MLSIICNANLNDQDVFCDSKSYRRLAADDYVKTIVDNSDLFDGLIAEMTRVFGVTTTTKKETDVRLESLKKYLVDQVKSENRLDYLALGISCLQLFARMNWLGPVPAEHLNLPAAIQQQYKTERSHSEVLSLVKYFPLESKEYQEFQDNLRDVLVVDGESLFPVVKCLHLLLIARLLFLNLNDKFTDLKFFNWWSLRTIYLYQQLLEEKSATLSKMAVSNLKTMTDVFTDLENGNNLTNISKNAVIFASINFYLEAGHIQYQIYNWGAGQECFRKALTMSKINYEFVGMYGKRTRYQQKDLAQLLLKVDSAKTASSQELHDFFDTLEYSNHDLPSNHLPKNLALNDDTLLEKIKLSKREDEEALDINRKLSQLEQMVLLCCLFDFQKNNAQHELTLEELSPIIEYLLAHPKNWCVQLCTLFTRAKLENKNSRRMERSIYQLENLCDTYRQPTEEPSLKQRLPFFYSILYPSFWVLQKELAKTYMQIGMINSSLDIYLNLKMWDDVIVCYQALDKRDRAEEVIRQQLAIRETPDLYCSLGEVTKDECHFHKAIELSHGRSARAYRLLAKFYFSKQRYDEAITNFEKSLEINSMQYDAWFMLGSAAFRTEKWESSVKAFRACTSLDPENYQNWNNLAASYIKLNKKDKAYNVFQEALKSDYENWKIWENFLWTSTDCGYFEDVIKAYHRLLDLKEKYVDVDVLKALNSAARNKLVDANNVPVARYKQKFLELFGRLTSLIVNDWQVYWYYADTVLALSTATSGADESTTTNDDCNSNQVELDSQAAEKYFGLLLKAFRGLYNQSSWELSVDKCKEVIKHSSEILKKCNQYGKYLNSPKDTLGSLLLSTKGIVNKLKLKYSVDEANSSPPVIRLLYLKEVNDEFVDLQTEFVAFNKNFFS